MYEPPERNVWKVVPWSSAPPDVTYGWPAGSASRQPLTGVQLCAQGFHAWVPWLRLDNGSWTTWCAREGCDHREQFDA